MSGDSTARPGGGRILVVSTPIGNLGDISARARESLQSADVVACEDTRHTGRLLTHLGIQAKMVSLHDHNEDRRLPQLLERLREGDVVALVSDAGTPAVCDPGFRLLRAAASEDIRIEAIPGASAVLAALVSSALPPYPFTFLGFPPPKKGRVKKFFERFAQLEHTLLFYESPLRLATTLATAAEVFGDQRDVAVARELTKLHEEIVRGPLGETAEAFAQRARIKGEIVVVIGPPATRRSVAKP